MSLDYLAQYLQIEKQPRLKENPETSVYSNVHMAEKNEVDKASENSFNQKIKFQNNKKYP